MKSNTGKPPKMAIRYDDVNDMLWIARDGTNREVAIFTGRGDSHLALNFIRAIKAKKVRVIE